NTSSFPRHEGCVDHVCHALPADRADGEVYVLQPKSVGRYQLKRKTFRSELFERELTGPEAVTARTLDGDILHRDAAYRKICKRTHLSLDNDRTRLALKRFDTEQNRDRSRARGAVEYDINSAAGGDFFDARERVFAFDINHEIGAKFPGHRESGSVLRGTGDDYERSA